MKTSLILTLSALLLVTGCSSREEVDKKLAKGCEAGARSLLDNANYDRQISRIKKKTFSTDDQGRTVMMEAVVKNKAYGYETDEVLVCVFSEEYSMAFIRWSATLEKLTIGEDVYGRDSGAIKGDMQDFMRLNDAVLDAMK